MIFVHVFFRIKSKEQRIKTKEQRAKTKDKRVKSQESRHKTKEFFKFINHTSYTNCTYLIYLLLLMPIEYFEIPFSECIQTNRAMILSGLLLAGSKLDSIVFAIGIAV
jgi:hypothetical protein